MPAGSAVRQSLWEPMAGELRGICGWHTVSVLLWCRKSHRLCGREEEAHDASHLHPYMAYLYAQDTSVAQKVHVVGACVVHLEGLHMHWRLLWCWGIGLQQGPMWCGKGGRSTVHLCGMAGSRAHLAWYITWGV